MSFIDNLSKKVYGIFSSKPKQEKDVQEEELESISIDLEEKEAFENGAQIEVPKENTIEESLEIQTDNKQPRKRNRRKKNNTEDSPEKEQTFEEDKKEQASEELSLEEPTDEAGEPAEVTEEKTCENVFQESEEPAVEILEAVTEEPSENCEQSKETEIKQESKPKTVLEQEQEPKQEPKSVSEPETEPEPKQELEPILEPDQKQEEEIPEKPVEKVAQEEKISEEYFDIPTNAKVFSFKKLPETLEDMGNLPEMSMDTPYKTAALTVLAYTAFEENPQESQKMFQTLCGSRALCESEWQILTKNIREDVSSIKNHFCGSVMGDKYVLDKPYTLGIMESDDSFEKEGFAVLYIVSGRNEKAGSVRLRLSNDGKWYFWDQELFG